MLQNKHVFHLLIMLLSSQNVEDAFVGVGRAAWLHQSPAKSRVRPRALRGQGPVGSRSGGRWGAAASWRLPDGSSRPVEETRPLVTSNRVFIFLLCARSSCERAELIPIALLVRWGQLLWDVPCQTEAFWGMDRSYR